MPGASLPSTESTDLMVAAKIIGVECSQVNQSFLECKDKDKNPRACLAPGEQVAACVFGVLRDLEKHCGDTFKSYKNAMDERWHEVNECRKEQAAMEACWRSFKTPPQQSSETNTD